MSGFFFDKTPTKRTNGDSEESSNECSPLTEFHYDSNSPVINWDFPKPRVSRKVKEAAKALAQTMSNIGKPKRSKMVLQMQRGRSKPRTSGDFPSSPLSHFTKDDKIDQKKKIQPRAKFDFEALEKIDLGQLDSETVVNIKAGLSDDSSNQNSPSSSSSSAKSIQTSQNALTTKGNKRKAPHTANQSVKLGRISKEQESPRVNSDSLGGKRNQSKEKENFLIDQLLDDDLAFFMTPELASL
ncbi:uncharacterized protein LOC106663297 [Cimex lectularius]|uniref:Uncharacterized protein n=1 Tax=Cimex lectularius TaxID=79782 RepID=A0A8I6RCI7_CIMLE|nr:uncharacterized protein LOC106663297 [Cimex lectularius]